MNLSKLGWQIPSQRHQDILFRGITTVRADRTMRGRGSPVVDLVLPEGDDRFRAAGLKYTEKKKGTYVLTVGNPRHIEMVMGSWEFSELDLLQIVVRPKGEGFEAASLNPAAEWRAGGKQMGLSGEDGANKLSHPHPLQVRIRRQKASSGKVYEYTSLEMCTGNFRKPLEWVSLESWEDLGALMASGGVFWL